MSGQRQLTELLAARLTELISGYIIEISIVEIISHTKIIVL